MHDEIFATNQHVFNFCVFGYNCFCGGCLHTSSPCSRRCRRSRAVRGFSAVQRSRVDEISVASLYFLSGQVADKQVQKIMNGCLITQLVIGLAGAIARSSTDGKAGSTLAFGVLVPLLGLGLNGLWASQFGTFTPREHPDRQG